MIGTIHVYGALEFMRRRHCGHGLSLPATEHTVVSVRLITEERGRQMTFVNETSQVKRNSHGTLGQLFKLSKILVPS